MNIILPKSLENDIMQFCKLNEIKEINDFLVSCLSKGYYIIKYGATPKDNFNKENKPLEIEKYEEKERITVGVEEVTKKRRGRPPKQKEEDSKPTEKTEEEPIKVKKKIRILKT